MFYFQDHFILPPHSLSLAVPTGLGPHIRQKCQHGQVQEHQLNYCQHHQRSVYLVLIAADSFQKIVTVNRAGIDEKQIEKDEGVKHVMELIFIWLNDSVDAKEEN